MGVVLEIREGPMAGKVIGLKTGESVSVGRAAGRAQVALPHDTFMSGVHFAVECQPGGCRVQDRKSSNGMFLNGARIQDAMIANGDEIKGGRTIVAVKIVADAKLGSLMPPQEPAQLSASQQQPFAAEPFGPPQQRARLRSILSAAAPQAYEPCRIGTETCNQFQRRPASDLLSLISQRNHGLGAHGRHTNRCDGNKSQ